MLTPDDLVDAIWEHLPIPTTELGGSPKQWENAAAGRLFLSEYDVRLRFRNSRGELVLPRGAILSPLALEWLELKNIRVKWN